MATRRITRGLFLSDQHGQDNAYGTVQTASMNGRESNRQRPRQTGNLVGIVVGVDKLQESVLLPALPISRLEFINEHYRFLFSKRGRLRSCLLMAV